MGSKTEMDLEICDAVNDSNSEVMGTWQYNYIKSYYFLLGYANSKGFTNMQKALLLASEFHEGQFRKGGAKYIVHPLRVCSYLVALNLADDVLLSAALLHDVVEDNEEINKHPKMLVEEYGLSHKVLKVVLALTKSKGLTKEQEERYYKKIKKNWRALIVKLSDRVNNLSTMQSFSPQKRLSYIEETREFILPLCSYCKKNYSNLSNVVTIMKYHITSICDTVKFMLQEQEQ